MCAPQAPALRSGGSSCSSCSRGSATSLDEPQPGPRLAHCRVVQPQGDPLGATMPARARAGRLGATLPASRTSGSHPLSHPSIRLTLCTAQCACFLVCAGERACRRTKSERPSAHCPATADQLSVSNWRRQLQRLHQDRTSGRTARCAGAHPCACTSTSRPRLVYRRVLVPRQGATATAEDSGTAATRPAAVAVAVGVTTGRVFCGEAGCDTRREYTLMGAAVNMAARLMQAAQKMPEAKLSEVRETL